MALGQHLVRELGIEESNDTLGRWLAHELAGLIHDAEHAPTERARARARREVVHVVTQLWAHRADLPGRAYPLAPYRDLLGAISLFTEDDSRPWWGYAQRATTTNGERAAAIFRTVGRLLPLLLFLEGVPSEAPPAAGPAMDGMDSDEQALIAALNAWYDALTPAAMDESLARTRGTGDELAGEVTTGDDAGREASSEGVDSEDQEAGLDPARLRAVALRLVDELTQDLAALRSSLDPSAVEMTGPDIDDDRVTLL